MPYLKFSCCGKKWKKHVSPAQDPVTQCRRCYSEVVAESYEELEFYCEECDWEWSEYWLEDTDDAPVSQCDYCEREVVAESYDYLTFVCNRCRRKWEAYWHEEDDPVSQCDYCEREVVAESYEYLTFVCNRCRRKWEAYWHEEDDPVDDCARCHREVLATAYQLLTFQCEACNRTWSEYWPTTSDEDCVSECEGCGELVVANTYEYRQFACGACEEMWWATVPQHYHLCYCIGRCGQRLRPIPRRKEYGIGEHICECGHVFHGRTQATVSSPCFKCDRNCLPHIIPDKLELQRRSRHTHNCDLCKGRGGCINFQRIIHTSEVV